MNWITSFIWPAGRVSRLGFWLGWLLLWAVQAAMLTPHARAASMEGAGPPVFWTAVGLISWAGFCLRTRRLHDFDGTFLWLLVPALAVLVTGGLAVALIGMLWGFALPVAVPLVLGGLLVLVVFDVVIGSKRTTGADGLPINRA